MKTILLLIITSLVLSGCMTKATIDTETILADGSSDRCKATYTNYKDSSTTNIGACGGGGKSEGSTSNTILMELLLRGLQSP